MNSQPDQAIAELRIQLDTLRRSFAAIALRAQADEPTRFFSLQAIDAFESLDRAMRSLNFAYRHSESGGSR